MNMKIRNMIAMVCVITGLTAGITQAATITLNHYSEMRYDAYNDGTTNLIGVYGPPSVPNNFATQFYVYNPSLFSESRTVWQFQLNELDFTGTDVISATVKWGSTTPWGGGYILGIDVVNSDFNTWNNTPMYGFEANGVTFGYNLANSKWNGTSVESRNDVTSAFKFALDNSTPTKGLALRFYQDALPGQNAGGYFDPVTIEVVTVPEPSTYALVVGGIATLFLIRRRVQA
jgi:hypothetical protein